MIAASITDFETRFSTSDSSNNLSLLSDISDFMGENILEDADATRLEDIAEQVVEKQIKIFNEALIAAEGSEDWAQASSIINDQYF